MSKTAKTFKELVVWQKAHEFVLAVYHLTAKFPTVNLETFLDEVSKLLSAYSLAVRTNKRGTRNV